MGWQHVLASGAGCLLMMPPLRGWLMTRACTRPVCADMPAHDTCSPPSCPFYTHPR